MIFICIQYIGEFDEFQIIVVGRSIISIYNVPHTKYDMIHCIVFIVLSIELKCKSMADVFI